MSKSLQEQLEEMVDYIDDMFPKEKRPRTRPHPDHARGQALVLLGMAKRMAKRLAEAYALEARIDELKHLIGKIERWHLGDGLDGDDRWGHCAAEVIMNTNDRLAELERKKG